MENFATLACNLSRQTYGAGHREGGEKPKRRERGKPGKKPGRFKYRATPESGGPPAFDNIYNERKPSRVLRENEFPVTRVFMEHDSPSSSSLATISAPHNDPKTPARSRRCLSCGTNHQTGSRYRDVLMAAAKSCRGCARYRTMNFSFSTCVRACSSENKASWAKPERRRDEKQGGYANYATVLRPLTPCRVV